MFNVFAKYKTFFVPHTTYEFKDTNVPAQLIKFAYIKEKFNTT